MSRGVRIAELFGVVEGQDNEEGGVTARKGAEKGKEKAKVQRDDDKDWKVDFVDEELQQTAREIEEVPLCASCAAEINSSKLDSEQVAELGVSRIEQTDLGLSRARWTQQRGSQPERPEPSEQMQQRQHLRAPEYTASLKERTRIFQHDGSEDWENQSYHPSRTQQYPSDGETFGWSSCPVPLDSCIYVSMSNPLGKPAFKPSPTKPIPLWMTLLSRNWYDTISWQQRPTSMLDAHFPRRAAREPPTSSLEKLFCPAPHTFQYARRKPPISWERPAEARTHKSEGSVALEEMTDPRVDEGNTQFTEPPRKGWLSPPAVSYVSKEPLIRPSSRQSLVKRDEVDSIDQRMSNAKLKAGEMLSIDQPPVELSYTSNAPNATLDTLHPADTRSHKPSQEPQNASLSPEGPTIRLKAHRSDGSHVISAHASQIRRMARSPNPRKPSNTKGSTTAEIQKVPVPMRSSEFLSRYPVVATGRTVLVPSDLSRQEKNAGVADGHGSSVSMRRGSKSIASIGTVSRDTVRGKVATVRTEGGPEDRSTC